MEKAALRNKACLLEGTLAALLCTAGMAAAQVPVMPEGIAAGEIPICEEAVPGGAGSQEKADRLYALQGELTRQIALSEGPVQSKLKKEVEGGGYPVVLVELTAGEGLRVIAYSSEAKQSCEGLDVAASERARFPVKNLCDPVTVKCVPDDDGAMPAWWVRFRKWLGDADCQVPGA